MLNFQKMVKAALQRHSVDFFLKIGAFCGIGPRIFLDFLLLSAIFSGMIKDERWCSGFILFFGGEYPCFMFVSGSGRPSQILRDYTEFQEEWILKKYTIGLYEKAMPKSLNWRQMLECAKECGYDFVEISIDETDMRLSRLEWTKEERL